MARFAVLAFGCLFLILNLLEAQSPKDLPKYIKNLTAKDPQERIAACEGIGAIGEVKKVLAKDAVDPLCDVLRSAGNPTAESWRPPQLRRQTHVR